MRFEGPPVAVTKGTGQKAVTAPRTIPSHTAKTQIQRVLDDSTLVQSFSKTAWRYTKTKQDDCGPVLPLTGSSVVTLRKLERSLNRE